jgi:hypothetical protein
MNTYPKMFSVDLRTSELCSSVIIEALVSRFLYLLEVTPNEPIEDRPAYAEATSLGCVFHSYPCFLSNILSMRGLWGHIRLDATSTVPSRDIIYLFDCSLRHLSTPHHVAEVQVC